MTTAAAANVAVGQAASLSDIYSILSDVDCARMLQMIFEHRQPKISDFGTRKRYYVRLVSLEEAHLVTPKKKRGKDNSTGHEITDLGLTLCESLLSLRRVVDLYWNLKAIDALEGGIQFEERSKLVEELVTDEAIRKILLEKD